MKKLLILVMILAMASFAGATLKISVNGVVGGPEITLHPSETAVLDIATNTPIAPNVGEGYFALVSSPLGSIDIATGFTLPAYAQDGGVALEHSAPVSEYVTGLPLGVDGIGGGILLSLISGIPAGTIFDGIIFHCEGKGDAMVTLLALDANFGVIGAVDQVIIHQVPEPVTMALLGLGGLFLRRRMA